MLTNKKRSFTLVELIMVIAIIGILMLGMTVYLGNSGDRAKSIEAEGCANALGGALGNYTYYTLTSKNLRFPDNHTVSPKYYYIQLTGGTSDSAHRCTPQNALSGFLCQDIILGYATGYYSGSYDPDLNIQEYQTINAATTCRHGNANLGFYRSGGQHTGDIAFVRMNKGFTPREVEAEKVFFLKDNGGTNESDTKLLVGDIIVVRCPEKSCEGWKQIGKRHVDTRAQTISFKRCKYYGDEGNICKTREDCVLYNSEDPTVCEKY